MPARFPVRWQLLVAGTAVVTLGASIALAVLRPSWLPVLAAAHLAAYWSAASQGASPRPGVAQLVSHFVTERTAAQAHAAVRGLTMVAGASAAGLGDTTVVTVALTYALMIPGLWLLPGATDRGIGGAADARGLAAVLEYHRRLSWFDARSQTGARQRLRLRQALMAAEVPLVVAVIVAALGGSTAGLVVAPVCAALAGAVVLLQAVTFVRSALSARAGRIFEVVRAALDEHAPEFLVYFSAPATGVYQLRQWLPHLITLGRPFAVFVRSTALLQPVADLAPGVPVVLVQELSRLDGLVPSSTRAVLYVNNGMRNGHMLRATQLQHVQLLHGESDKAPSANKLVRAYDRIFVAGQAAIDRYARFDVEIPASAFRIVGRPQTDDISTEVPAGRPTVLYAPTWEGWDISQVESSVGLLGVDLVTRLLARGDVRVIVRPHPTTGLALPALARQVGRIRELIEQAGGDHVFSTADGELSLVDCFNSCTVMIADISSVMADYLHSDKALVVTDVDGIGPDQVARRYPTAAAAYVLAPDASNIDEILDQVFGPDPLRDQRRVVRRYVLGDFDGPAEPVFHQRLREVLDAPSPRLRDHLLDFDPGSQDDVETFLAGRGFAVEAPARGEGG